jgi:hypothetical protein
MRLFSAFQLLMEWTFASPALPGVVVIVLDKVPPEPALTQALTVVVNRVDQKICTSRRG